MKIRAAVVGVGYLGNFHVQKYRALPAVEVVGIVDTNPARLREIADHYQLPAYTELTPLLGQVDIVSIVTPPPQHFATARACIEAGIHVLVEKPVTETIDEAQILIDLARRQGCVFQVGHLERFNPAVIAVRERINQPYRIEASRLAKYQKRGTEVDVVLDLMIHDIDIVASLVASPVVELAAHGAIVVTGDIDVAHATIHFANGCVADLAASRVHREGVRSMLVYQRDSYISVDYLTHTLLCGALDSAGCKVAPASVEFETHTLARTDVLMDEIVSFVDAVRNGEMPAVSGEDGKRALELAVEISQLIRRRHQLPRDLQAG